MATTHEQSKAYYEDYSLAVGQRDWLKVNDRHEQLKALIRDLLRHRTGLTIADVGCGAGVMTHFLTRYGRVIGVDFSSGAVRAATHYAPRATFSVGGAEALPRVCFDLITLFDVLEHIPAEDRPGLLRALRGRLAEHGLLFCSTPFPEWTRSAKLDQLQIIDEAVELPTIISEAADADLQLVGFQAYDVFSGTPEFQAMVFTPRRSPGGPPVLRHPRMLARRPFVRYPLVQRARRLMNGARMMRRGDLRTAWWFLTAETREVTT